MVEHPSCRCSAQAGDPVQRFPLPLQCDLDGVFVPSAYCNTPSTAALAASVGCDAPDDPQQPLRQSVVVTFVFEALGGQTQMQWMSIPNGHVRSCLTQEMNQPLFQCGRQVETARRRALHPLVDKGGKHCVIAGNAQSL